MAGVPTEEGSKAFLEPRALSSGRFFLQTIQGEPHLPRAPFAGIALQEVRKREAVPAVQVFGLLDHRHDFVD
jgi:hypothetical protein